MISSKPIRINVNNVVMYVVEMKSMRRQEERLRLTRPTHGSRWRGRETQCFTENTVQGRTVEIYYYLGRTGSV